MGRRLTLSVVAALALGAGGFALAATLNGTNGPDALKGGPGGDRINGRGGADLLRGLGGRDRLAGGGGGDSLSGGRDKDKLAGGAGADLLDGGRATDRLDGGKGRDGYAMVAGVPQGSPGNDVIDARDGEADEINCGAGFDKVFVDKVEDGVYDCEKVIVPGGTDLGVPPPEASP